MMMFFVFQVSSVSASTPLNEKIDELVGVKYKYGGTTVHGFDCSGFTSFVFKKLGVQLQRTSRTQQQVRILIQEHKVI